MSIHLLPGEIVVDAFAGGGGASEGIEQALGRCVDIAINHNPLALAMHAANHPGTLHLPHNVWKVDPVAATRGRPVGLLWASPDCKHFSKAKGGAPVKRNIRDLAWVVVRWARQVRPRVIMLENVEEFRGWGPIGEDGRPCVARKGQTFKAWIAELKRLGYKVEHRELRACDYGAPTIRKRLFLIARRDGLPIVWPKPTHGAPDQADVLAGKLLPWRTAAEIIDWSEPCSSIFETSEEIMARFGIRAVRPLAPNTMARIAKGVKRYVLHAGKPFIVPVTHPRDTRVHDIVEPLRTVTGAQRGEQALVTPFVTKFRAGATGSALDEPLGTVTANSFIKRPGGAAPVGLVAPVIAAAQQGGMVRDIGEPLHTVTASPKDQNQVIAAHVQRQFGGSVGHAFDEPAGSITAGGGGKSAVVAAFLAQNNYLEPGHDAREPVSTIVARGSTQAVVSAGLVNMRGSDRRAGEIEAPVGTVTSQGTHVAEVRAFLLKYYGNETEGHDPADPLGTVTTRDRFGLVNVEGEPYEIVDIGMRMLTPRELFRAQGFTDEYIIDFGILPDGSRVKLTKTQQVGMCGNSVCPPLARALVAANFAGAAVETAPVRRPAASAPLFEMMAGAA